MTMLFQILFFKLIYFFTSRQTMQKKKLNSYIQFSQTLDMAQYLNVPVELNASSKELHMYNLCAVLIHKGSSAYSGHYVGLYIFLILLLNLNKYVKEIQHLDK